MPYSHFGTNTFHMLEWRNDTALLLQSNRAALALMAKAARLFLSVGGLSDPHPSPAEVIGVWQAVAVLRSDCFGFVHG
jgi:hypothetical protein